MRPMLGPENPSANNKNRIATQNVLTGHVEQQAISESDFRQQLRTFETYGYARDPSVGNANLSGQTGQGIMGTGYVGNLAAAAHMSGASIYDSVPKDLRPNQDLKKRRNKKGDLSVVEGENAYKGPWAGYEGEEELKQKRVTAPPEGEGEEGEDKKQKQDEDVEDEEEMGQSLAAPGAEPGKKKRNRGMEFGTEQTTFHGQSEYDYLGRTYMAVPQDLDVNLMSESGTQECFIPKKCIHTWDGHARGVSAIRFLPQSAHLLLSAGMDNKVKVIIIFFLVNLSRIDYIFMCMGREYYL